MESERSSMDAALKLLDFCREQGYSYVHLDAAYHLVQFCEEQGIDTAIIGQMSAIHDTLEYIEQSGGVPMPKVDDE